MTDLQKYLLHLADNNYILSHRLSEYSSHAPFLEEDLANTNIALDLIGMAENIYVELGKQLNQNPDDFVHRRIHSEFLNCNIVEQPNTDFAFIIVRQFMMDAFNYYLYSELTKSEDEFLKVYGLKSIKEVTYHLKRSSEWMIRLGNGTEESKARLERALHHLWNFHSELFTLTDYESTLQEAGNIPNYKAIQKSWVQKMKEIFYMSNVTMPNCTPPIFNGKNGKHSEYLGQILADVQFLANKYPDAVW